MESSRKILMDGLMIVLNKVERGLKKLEEHISLTLMEFKPKKNSSVPIRKNIRKRFEING